MNILRWNRKSKKKIKPKTLLLFIFSLIMTTFAWFAYSKVLEPTLNIHLASWDMSYEIGGEPTDNPISIEIPVLSPAMAEKTVVVDIFNNGETKVDIDCQVKSLTIAGEKYDAIAEGETPPESGNYITIAPAVLETVESTIETTDEESGETTTTTVTKQLYKGAVTNDITRFPFTIELEYSTQVDAVTEDLYGGANTPGEGYLKVTVNWVGDNDRLDSEWGYIVGDYLADQEDGTPAMTIVLSIDSYQVDPDGGTTETTMPSTASTRPYLPDGFKRVLGTSLTTGLVIEDENGNQYVWVEVPRTTSIYTTAGIKITDFTTDAYTKIETDLRNYVSAYSTRSDVFLDYDATGLSIETYPVLKNKMLKSIYSHGGFYIGRYETGLEGEARTKATSTTPSDTPVIKANVYPYNWVTCSQAHTIASRLSQTGYTTSLMFGLQWDLVLKYLETKGAIEEEDSWLTTDSTPWGNYLNNSYTLTNSKAIYNQSTTGWVTTIPFEKNEDAEVLVSSGANSGFCLQNIYDFAGNLSEWTYNVNEVYEDDGVTKYYVGGNGGNYLTNGSDAPANYYGSYNARTGVKHIGFRVSLISEADAEGAWGDGGSSED